MPSVSLAFLAYEEPMRNDSLTYIERMQSVVGAIK